MGRATEEAGSDAGAHTIRGRGAARNPANRFEQIEVEVCELADEETADGVARASPTRFLDDTSRSILSRNDSPDVPFEVSANPYRGCEHGCVYCYARPSHEYLGYSAGLDFEITILVKRDAPALLRKALGSSKWNPQTIALSGVTDCYQPVERHLKLTRGCLKVLAEFRNPVGVVTKNHMVVRDADILGSLARVDASSVTLSVTTLDTDLASRMEPRASTPERRLDAIENLSDAGIPVGVLVAPVIPGLNDHEVPQILEAAAAAGASHASYLVLRLPFGLGPQFEEWLERWYPDRWAKVMNRIRHLRDGKLNDPRFGSRMRGTGVFADQVRDLFEISCRRAGLARKGPELSTRAFRRATEGQGELF